MSTRSRKATAAHKRAMARRRSLQATMAKEGAKRNAARLLVVEMVAREVAAHTAEGELGEALERLRAALATRPTGATL